MGNHPFSRWLFQVGKMIHFGRGKFQPPPSIVNELIRYHPLARQLQTALDHNQAIVLLYVDIVKMKEIESRVGDELSAKLIQILSDAIQVCLHATLPRKDILSIENFWADDFLVCIAAQNPTEQQIYELSNALRRDISYQMNQETVQTLGLQVDLHVGYAIMYQDRGILEKQLYVCIKQAMRMAKKGDNARSSLLYGEFQSILLRRDIRSVYQPIVDLELSQVIGWEALSRGPKGSYFERPDVLFASGEEYGDLYTLERICREAAITNLQQLGRDRKLFLNMNPKMIDDARFSAGWTKQILQQRNIKPDQVVFEITERNSIRDFHSFRRALNHYRDQGYLIAVDDVGAGYSNLQSIVELAPDIIKMDMSLIRNIDQDPIRQAILEAFVTIANKVNCKLLAEGIETDEELRMIKRLGVQFGQGYLLGRPDARQQMEVPGRALHLLSKRSAAKLQYRHRQTAEIGDICSRTYTISRSTEVRALHELFEQQRDISSVVVMEGTKPIGMVTRQHLFRMLGWRYGVPLYFNKTIDEVMDDTPLMLDRRTSVERAASYATERSKQKMYDDVIVMDGEYYYGVVTVHHILQSMSRIQIELAKYANPLTGLPGNVRIEEELRHRLDSGVPFDVLYADLNAFKAFNDKYGFERGDRLILLTARILQRAIRECGHPEDFVGHIGGDDYMIVVSANAGKCVGKAVIRQFERAKLFLKRQELNKHTAEHVSIALAALTCNPQLIQNHLQISEQAAGLKKMVKQYAGSTLLYQGLDGTAELFGNLQKRSLSLVR
ncbi:EAL domain-containing protein [Fodinisporobacter ferrooxydans]|uniref:EAL domain-containing protein n=1 Tax=Fodinisporobacter ferrooxydans TaxID=2901836 RepID=A0ABY4CLQ4_9BACL|nr:EAL domain-containing protein [Alicyclobacillaceae bacterium MYW30-H2]